MRDCYKKFWKMVLVEKMKVSFPQFSLRESASRRAADEAKPSSKPVSFVWNPVDKLIFVIEFTAPGRLDHFEANCRWSEQGKVEVSGLYWLDQPFDRSNFEAPSAVVMLQSLSLALKDDPRFFDWKIWEPKTSQFDDEKAWHAEFMAEEMRAVGDAEARERVESAVDKAMVDIERCALPWFKNKLDWYGKHCAQ